MLAGGAVHAGEQGRLGLRTLVCTPEHSLDSFASLPSAANASCLRLGCRFYPGCVYGATTFAESWTLAIVTQMTIGGAHGACGAWCLCRQPRALQHCILFSAWPCPMHTRTPWPRPLRCRLWQLWAAAVLGGRRRHHRPSHLLYRGAQRRRARHHPCQGGKEQVHPPPAAASCHCCVVSVSRRCRHAAALAARSLLPCWRGAGGWRCNPMPLPHAPPPPPHIILRLPPAQVAQPAHRAFSIYISDTAVIARRDGILKLLFRVADVRRTQVGGVAALAHWPAARPAVRCVGGGNKGKGMRAAAGLGVPPGLSRRSGVAGRPAVPPMLFILYGVLLPCLLVGQVVEPRVKALLYTWGEGRITAEGKSAGTPGPAPAAFPSHRFLAADKAPVLCRACVCAAARQLHCTVVCIGTYGVSTPPAAPPGAVADLSCMPAACCRGEDPGALRAVGPGIHRWHAVAAAYHRAHDRWAAMLINEAMTPVCYQVLQGLCPGSPRGKLRFENGSRRNQRVLAPLPHSEPGREPSHSPHRHLPAAPLRHAGYRWRPNLQLSKG